MRSNKLLALSIVFIIYLGSTSFWTGPATEYSGFKVLLHTVATAVFVLATYDMMRGERRRLFSQVYLGAALAISIVSLMNFVMGHDRYFGRLSSAVHGEHPNLFAHYLGIAALINLDLMLRRSRGNTEKIALALSFTVLWITIGLTRGRIALVALCFCCAFVVLRNASRRWILSLTAIMVAGVLLPTPKGTPLLAGFMARGGGGRDVLYTTTLERWAARPLFGSGINAVDDIEFPEGSQTFPNGHTAKHPHSAFIGTIYYGGVAGFLLLLGIVTRAAIISVASMRRTGDWLPLSLLTFGVLCLLADGHRLVSEPHLSSWLLLWFPIALIAQEEPPSSQASTPAVFVPSASS